MIGTLTGLEMIEMKFGGGALGNSFPVASQSWGALTN